MAVKFVFHNTQLQSNFLIKVRPQHSRRDSVFNFPSGIGLGQQSRRRAGMQDFRKKTHYSLERYPSKRAHLTPLPVPGIRRSFVKLRANGRKPTTPNNCWPTMLGFHVARSLTDFKICVTTPNNMQQDATEFATHHVYVKRQTRICTKCFPFNLSFTLHYFNI